MEEAFKQDDAAAEAAAQHAFNDVGKHMGLVMADIQAAEQQYRATLQGLWGTYKEHHSRLATIKQASSIMYCSISASTCLHLFAGWHADRLQLFRERA